MRSFAHFARLVIMHVSACTCGRRVKHAETKRSRDSKSMTATRVGRCKSRRHDAMTPAATIVVNRLPALSAHDDSLLALALALFS